MGDDRRSNGVLKGRHLEVRVLMVGQTLNLRSGPPGPSGLGVVAIHGGLDSGDVVDPPRSSSPSFRSDNGSWVCEVSIETTVKGEGCDTESKGQIFFLASGEGYPSHGTTWVEGLVNPGRRVKSFFFEEKRFPRPFNRGVSFPVTPTSTLCRLCEGRQVWRTVHRRDTSEGGGRNGTRV